MALPAQVCRVLQDGTHRPSIPGNYSCFVRLGGTSPTCRGSSTTSLACAELPDGPQDRRHPVLRHPCQGTGPEDLRPPALRRFQRKPSGLYPSLAPHQWGLLQPLNPYLADPRPQGPHLLPPAAAGSSQCPGLFTTIPSLKLGTLPGTAPRRAGHVLPSVSSAGLAVATPGLGISVGGRSSFATNPYSARPAGRSQTAGAPSKDSDEAVESDITKLAQDAGRKRHLEEDDGDEEEEVPRRPTAPTLKT